MGRIMKEIVNEYRESLLESHKSDNTVYAYVTDVNLYIKYLNSKDIYLDETDNTTVKNYIDHLLEEGKSERSISRIVISLRSFYNYLVREGIVIKNYFRDISNPKRAKSLPKYAKDSKKAPDGGKLRKDYQEMMKLLKQNVNGNELLFEKLPKAFGLNEFHESLADNVTSAKEYYDSYLSKVKKALRDEIKNIFVMQDLAPQVRRMSLSSVIKDWCESIDQSAFEQLFTDGTDRCLGLFKNISNDDDATTIAIFNSSTNDDDATSIAIFNSSASHDDATSR